MSSVNSQIKWMVKNFSAVLLVLFVITAGVAYFSTKISANNFNTIAVSLIVLVLLLAYYNLINLRSGIVFALLAVVLVVGVHYSKHPNIKTGQFQSVTLANGTTYFGHLKNVDSPTATLSDVYFLRSAPQQSSSSTTTQTAQSQAPVLVKLSNDLHNPEDEMTIKSSQILYWENLQDSGKVVKAINKDLQKN